MSVRPPPPTPRSSLSALSREIGRVPLTTLVAPAGSGKSTLMAHWRDALPGGLAPVWLEVVPPHSDLATFTLDLLDAVRRQAPRFGQETQRAIANVASGAEDWRVAHRAFVRDWLSVTGEIVLFLDNFHAVEPESGADAFVSELLRGLPLNLHLVVASRGTLPSAATRLQAGGVVLEVGVDDLNLRAEEAAEVLAQRGVAPEDELVATLLGQTEGWVTGVLLAARVLTRVPEGERQAYAARLAQERDLFAYVAAEVLSGEPEPVVAALERAALLGRCEIDDLARILDDPDPHQQIAQALDHGLLLGDGHEIWIHQLWQELMRSRLRERLAPDAWRALHGRVAALLAERGRVEDALEAYRESEDWDAIAYLLHGVGHEWLERGRARGVRRWLAALPASVRDSEPRLLEMQGMLLMVDEPAEATRLLEEAVRGYGARGEDAGTRGVLGILAYHHLSRFDLHRTQKALRRSFRPQRLIRDPAERADLYVGLAGLAFMRRRFARSIKLSERARRAPVGAAIRWLNLGNLGLLYSLSGDLEKARRLLDESLADPGIARRAFAYYPLLLLRGHVLSRLGDLAAGWRDVEAAREGIDAFRLQRFRPVATLVGADIAGLIGDRESCERDFAETLEHARKYGTLALEALARGQMALRWFRWDEPELALAEARRAVEVHERGIADGSVTFPWWLPLSLWVLGRLGDPKEAWQRLLPHRRTVLPDGLPMTRITVLLTMADLAHRAGAPREARQLAIEAWKLAERTGAGFDRTAGPAVLPYAAEEALRQGVAADVAFDALRMHRPDAVPALLGRLARDRSPEVRLRAVERMRQFGGRVLHPALVRASKDRNARVRAAAERALPELDLRPDYELGIQALGGFRAFRGEAPVPDGDWRGKMSARLMHRLLAAEGRPVSRDVLQVDLWPDADEAAGRNNLRVALSRLSDALDPDRLAGSTAWFLSSGPTGLALETSRIGDYDVARFRKAVEAAERARGAGRMEEALAEYALAIEAYAGPFLPEAAYEEWALPLRRRLEDEFRSVGERYGGLLLDGARHAEAIRLADRLLDQDPADEGAWALRMKSQLVRGDRSGAFRTYERARESLRAALELEPGPALRDLAARARGEAGGRR